ncbi:ATP-dependent nuclease, partial [Vibrio campbellii]|uniref:ATP-dependent nuclease n=1 Tax=Vibrio campbellii TaxID=680 RepID=UPI00142D9A2A
MYISKIKVKNFKAYSSFEINCNNSFNVIVGENNIGKSTIFEAISVWKYAYDSLIQSRNKNKFYKASSNYYLQFSTLNQIRLVDDDDFFYDPVPGEASIELTIKDGEESFALKIRFVKPGIKNSYFRIFNNDNFQEFERFSQHIQGKQCSLKNAIFIYQTRPISTIYRDEPFYNNAQVEKKISIGKSHDVLRNKILRTEDSSARVSERFVNLERRLENVLNVKYSIRAKNKNRNDDEYVKITVSSDQHRALELSTMGSGFLQVAEIFSTIEYIENHADGICLILIDEPDSHIHTDLQSNLIDELKSQGNNQTFLITHNDRLTNKSEVGELYFLNSMVKEAGVLNPLEIDDFPSVKSGLASVLMALENPSEVPLVVTEGKTDQKILTIAWSKLYPDTDLPFEIISSGIEIDESSRRGSAESVRKSLEYASTISDKTIIGLFDNDHEGNVRFKGLSKDIFEEHSLESRSRKHLSKNIFGLTLPVPSHRTAFINEQSLNQRYIAIEHFFSDQVLESNNMKGESILPGSEVFEIIGNKNRFSQNCLGLPP